MSVWCSKGTILKQDLASTLTTVAQVTSLSIDGTETETFDATTLDQVSPFKVYKATGYTEPGSVSGELFWDPALSGHEALLALLAAPADETWQITWSDTGTTTQGFTGAGFSFGASAAMADGLKGTFSIKLTGNPGWPDGST